MFKKILFELLQSLILPFLRFEKKKKLYEKSCYIGNFRWTQPNSYTISVLTGQPVSMRSEKTERGFP